MNFRPSAKTQSSAEVLEENRAIGLSAKTRRTAKIREESRSVATRRNNRPGPGRTFAHLRAPSPVCTWLLEAFRPVRIRTPGLQSVPRAIARKITGLRSEYFAKLCAP